MDSAGRRDHALRGGGARISWIAGAGRWKGSYGRVGTRIAGRPMDAAVGTAGPDAPADLETGAGGEGCLGESGGRSRARRMGTEWLRFDSDQRLGSAHQPDQIAAFGVLQRVVPNHATRTPSACRSRLRTRVRIGAPPPARPRPVMSRTTAARASLGLDSQKALGVGHGLDHALAVQVERRIG